MNAQSERSIPVNRTASAVDFPPTLRCNIALRVTKARIHPGGQVAQLVEQGTENPRVGSSILSLATISQKPY